MLGNISYTNLASSRAAAAATAKGSNCEAPAVGAVMAAGVGSRAGLYAATAVFVE